MTDDAVYAPARLAVLTHTKLMMQSFQTNNFRE